MVKRIGKCNLINNGVGFETSWALPCVDWSERVTRRVWRVGTGRLRTMVYLGVRDLRALPQSLLQRLMLDAKCSPLCVKKSSE